MNRCLRVAIISFSVLAIVSAAEAKVEVAVAPLSSAGGRNMEPSLVSQVVQAELSQSESITLVDRDRMQQVLGELRMGQQGMLAPESAGRLGKLLGARYFCCTSLSKSGDKIMAVAKVVDVETTAAKVDYTYLTADDDAEKAGKSLAGQIDKLVAQFETERKTAGKSVNLAATNAIPSEWKRPSVMVIIREMHIRQSNLVDPAGETEIVKRLLASGFKVIDSEYVHMMKADQASARRYFESLKTSTQYAASKKAEVLIYGEALSEGSGNLGDFTGCRGRIELKAIRTTSDEILLSDSAEGGATDLTEVIAGKKAIQQAANRLADTFLHSLAQRWNAK